MTTCGHTLAPSHAQESTRLLLPIRPLLPSPPLLSRHPTSPWAKLRGGSGCADKQETLVTHYDKRRIILYDSRGIFSRGCVMCPSHSSIHLAPMKGHLSNLCQCVPGGGYKNKNPGEIDENVSRLFRATHAHTYIIPAALCNQQWQIHCTDHMCRKNNRVYSLYFLALVLHKYRSHTHTGTDIAGPTLVSYTTFQR